ncbi:Crp/Fnr family transcriptional regulator [Oceanobacillus halotolerans]|uniref:Crp/Fnr family transcriptional regulator n=1 Tax=Oceanobacillus halotolerans TaxID=2663380 RepID=UPI0013DC0AFA|nr:Crp/Fnr family transcriptional regulator [Oceanobacillus halotolerans]
MNTELKATSNCTQHSIPGRLNAILHHIGTLTHYTQHEHLFQQGMSANHLFLIKSGLIQISMETEDRGTLVLRLCQQGDMLGDISVFNDDPKYLHTSTVLKPAEVLVINKDRLKERLLADSRLTFEFMKLTSNHMKKFEYQLKDLFFNGVKIAIYSTLIRLANSYGEKRDSSILIDIPLTNQELAQFCATTRESVNRTLRDLRNKNVIDSDHVKRILIKDMTFLRKEVGCDSCPYDLYNVN